MKIKSLLAIILCIFLFSCADKKKNTVEEADEEIVEAPTTDNSPSTEKRMKETITAADSAYVRSVLRELKGIEKFAVRENFYLLSSLMEHKGNTDIHRKIKTILEKKDTYVTEYYIEALDVKSGYIRFAPRAAEVTYTVTYWNLDNGAKLIATEDWGCGPVCASGISFEKYKDGNYETIETAEIIPEMAGLPTLLVPDYDETSDEPYEFKYVLPQKGKNIQFCLDSNCIELQWKNGTFKINNKATP